MERYLAVDSGKSSTKVAVYDAKTDSVRKFKYRTKIGPGNFEDDAIGKNTYVAEYDGKVYKIGNAAATEAEMNTSKKAMVHKVCTMLALAMVCSEDEEDEMHVSIGMPVKDWDNVELRNEYRNFILPDGKITVKYVKDGDEKPVTKTFTIASKHVYPETMGALFVGEKVNTGTVGIIDIGHLNLNLTVYNNLEPDRVYSLTDTTGGNNLVTGLSQELSSTFSLCDEKMVARILMKTGDERCLKPNRPNPEVEQRSREIISQYLLDYVREIKKCCDRRRWPIDYMDLYFMGGTTSLIRGELKEVFGDQITILDHPEYVNALGFLRIMCGKLLDKMISVDAA
jgi:plasmid segregation protein ParM